MWTQPVLYQKSALLYSKFQFLMYMNQHVMYNVKFTTLWVSTISSFHQANATDILHQVHVSYLICFGLWYHMKTWHTLNDNSYLFFIIFFFFFLNQYPLQKINTDSTSVSITCMWLWISIVCFTCVQLWIL